MILVGVMAAALWGIGALTGAPRAARLNMIGLLMVAVIAGHLILPDGHPLREATGGEAAFWVLLLALGALVWLYTRGLALLKKRAAPKAPDAPARKGFSETELTRYARHIALREIGGPGQGALRRARVLVVGAGGLGCPALTYLAASGVGTIGVIDHDTVDLSNLGRQVLYDEGQIGMPKVHAAAEKLRAQNPHVEIRPYERRLTSEIAQELFGDYDLVLDGCDDFGTRAVVNQAAVATGTPLIAAALTQWEGQISLYHPAKGAPCWSCVFPERPDPALVPACAEAGVLGPLPGVLGAMMAAEAVKHLTGAGETLAGRLVIHDTLYAETRSVKLARRAGCPVCGEVNTA
ncbi:HesA/MoeB/ThiF family protein [Limimaricola pyoseonensis]|uniref:Molybdopterin-synthase adenylyltransferase n=1 Tax=Limimaricola pyoseonensis TaxID=521013 RepID=A0A1G7C855_9RHOB|nr:HesA/MoeB/ThiF family protein [Limimaricola pyoseonensis]SDE35498.1 Molybdopterin or thiamine biosynthesis adenylyltransferase [Limimaricola pyoseonensis]